jgi:hypothetical protein
LPDLKSVWKHCKTILTSVISETHFSRDAFVVKGGRYEHKSSDRIRRWRADRIEPDLLFLAPPGGSGDACGCCIRSAGSGSNSAGEAAGDSRCAFSNSSASPGKSAGKEQAHASSRIGSEKG